LGFLPDARFLSRHRTDRVNAESVNVRENPLERGRPDVLEYFLLAQTSEAGTADQPRLMLPAQLLTTQLKSALGEIMNAPDNQTSQEMNWADYWDSLTDQYFYLRSAQELPRTRQDETALAPGEQTAQCRRETKEPA
jgi:hypothetical protein